MVVPVGFQQAQNFPVQLQQFGNGVGRTAAPAAFGGYSELGDDLPRRVDAPLSTGEPMGEVNDTQVQFGSCGKTQGGERRQVRGTAVPGHRDVNELHRPGNLSTESRGEFSGPTRVDRGLHIGASTHSRRHMRIVAVTQVVAQLHRPGNALAQADEARQHLMSVVGGDSVADVTGPDPGPTPYFKRCIPLDRQLITGYRGQDLIELAEQCGLVRSNQAQSLGCGDEPQQGVDRRREAHLKPHLGRG